MRRAFGRGKKGVLDMITTAILLITFVVVILFLSVSIMVMNLKGDTAGKVLLKMSVGSMYNEERAILYLTDEYGNRITDLIGQALLISGAELVVHGDPRLKVSTEAIDTIMYTCPAAGTDIGAYAEIPYDITTFDLDKYLHCYLIPEKLSKMYGKERYCLYAIYDEGGTGTYTIYGNETLGCADEKKITADIAAPPGFDKPIYLRLTKI